MKTVTINIEDHLGQATDVAGDALIRHGLERMGYFIYRPSPKPLMDVYQQIAINRVIERLSIGIPAHAKIVIKSFNDTLFTLLFIY